ncbi:mucin-5AC-like [Pomacea canaliculata]|uniref:mucin-5AC-like n=1 Tax=Pomacea canaliculata TaxID=400727 RepID=UPI000D72807F|nr:mucin-5AC-like [Pomacea canaliculata]XP_025097394.1 mucin-5AC-like [Pomacea canaliculata]XP_025097395.1 mucin-5AC-like [Pomacea canaliculata]
MMESPPTSLSSPAVSAVNTAAKLQITPEGGLRLVTDKDVLGKEGSANGQQQQQQQQQFFATRTQDGKWNLLMAPTSDPSRLFLVQPAGGQRFQVATSPSAGATLRSGARRLDMPARRSSASTSSNGSSSKDKQDKHAGHALPQQDSVVIPVPQLRATSASLSTIAAPRMSAAAASSPSSKPVAVMRMATLPRLASTGKHMAVAPLNKSSAAARLSLSAGEGNSSSSKSGGGKGSRGCTRMAVASSGNRSKVVLVDSATLEKANRKAFGGEVGLNVAVPTSVVQAVPDGFSKGSGASPDKASPPSLTSVAGSSTAPPAATITAVTTITTTTVTTTTTAATTTSTVVTTSTTDASVIPRSRTPSSVASCEAQTSSASLNLITSAPPVEKISQVNGGKPATCLVRETERDRYSLLDNTDNSAQCQATDVADWVEKPQNKVTENPGRAVDDEAESRPSDSLSAAADIGSMEYNSERKEAADSTEPGSPQANSDEAVAKKVQDASGVDRINVPFMGRKHGRAQNGRTDLRENDTCGSDMCVASEPTPLVDKKGDDCIEKYKGKRKKKRIKEMTDKPLHRRLRERAKTCSGSSDLKKDQAGPSDKPNAEETTPLPAKTFTSGSPVDNAEWMTSDVGDTKWANSWEKPVQCTSAFVVLERLNNRDIAFLCRKFRNARVRSRCSRLCRLQTLHCLCSLGLLKCEDRLLGTTPGQPPKLLALPAPVSSVSNVVQDSSTESCSGISGEELEGDVTKGKTKRTKKRQLRDTSKKKSKTADSPLGPPASSKAPSTESSAEPAVATVSTSMESMSSTNKTSSATQPITGHFVIAPAFSRPILQVTTASSVQDTVMPTGTILVSSAPTTLLPSSVSLKQATRNSLSQAISKSLAKSSGQANTVVGGGDQVSASLTQVPPSVSSLSSSGQQMIFNPNTSSSVAKTSPNRRLGAVGALSVLPALAAKPTLRVPRPIRPPPPPPTSSTTSLPSSKVIVSSTNTVNKQFYLVQIGDKRLLVPVTTGATTATSASAIMTTSTTTSSAATSATVSVPVCLTSPSSIPSVVSKSASALRPTVVLAASKSGEEGRAAITPPPPPPLPLPQTLRPLSAVPALLPAKTSLTACAIAPKPANKAWSGPRTMASGDNRVILVPVNNVPSLLPRGLGLSTSSSSVVRRVNILGTPTGSSLAAALRPLGTTSLLKAWAASSLTQLRPPAVPGTTSGKRPPPMTEAERLAKRARLEKKYPLPPGVVIKTEPESHGYGDEAVVTTASSNTCIIRIASNTSIAGGARPVGGAAGVPSQGIRVGTPIIIRSGSLSGPAGQGAILTFMPAVVASDAAQRSAGTGAAAVTTTTAARTSTTTTTESLSQSAASIVTSSISSTGTTISTTKSATSQTSVPVTITAVTGLTQSEPVSSHASSSSTLLTTLVLPTSSSVSPSIPLASKTATPAPPSTPETIPSSVGEPPSSSSVLSPAAAPSSPESGGTAAQSSTSSSLTVTMTLPSPAPSPLASLGAMWMRQAADAPDNLPHIDASSLKGERVRRLRETLDKQLQNLGDERKQRALQALHKQLCVDD